MATLQKKTHAIQVARRRLVKSSGLAEIKQIWAKASVLRLEAKTEGELKIVRLVTVRSSPTYGGG